jgi:hypothetical protein
MAQNVSKVTFDFTFIPLGQSLVFSAPPLYKLGYFWWNEGVYSHPIQWINHAQSLFLPPNKNCDGFGWYIDPNTQATIIYYQYPLVPEMQFKGISINPLAGTASINLTPGE